MKTVEVKDWAQFQERVTTSAFTNERSLIWRGQRDPDWPLASSFERRVMQILRAWEPKERRVYPYEGSLLAGKDRAHTLERIKRLREELLATFSEAIAGLRGPNPPQLPKDPAALWSLGRHFGLGTPLLDWTEKPYVAAFFALEGFREEMLTRGLHERDRVAVFSLVEEPGISDPTTGDQLLFHRPRLEELPRMLRQRSVFTEIKSDRFFELEGFLKSVGKSHLLTRYLIPADEVVLGLYQLDQAGLDFLTLFPDLEGAARHANSVAEQRWLRKEVLKRLRPKIEELIRRSAAQAEAAKGE